MSVVSAERTKHGYGLGTEEGEAFWLLGMLETIKIGGEDTGGQYGLLEIVVRAGIRLWPQGGSAHVHRGPRRRQSLGRLPTVPVRRIP